ncbi:MAG: hypothetical protein ACPGRZ_11610 [Alphaproteobacteria bacterium]
MSLRPRVAGVDFSGARNAGKHIWVAEGTPTPDGVRIDALHRADTLPNGGADFDTAMTGLCEHVAGLSDSIVGFDFPFSIPASLIEQSTWPAFIRDFAQHYPAPEGFREDCRARTDGRELKRLTDVEAKVPWCAYNLRLYRQTWAGIRHVLAPLVSRRRARIIPIQRPKDGLPVIAEVCPASFLKRENLYFPYKGRGPELLNARSRILTELARRQRLMPVRGKLRKTMVEDMGGDALDAALSAICAAGVEDVEPRSAADRLECRVYF